MLSSPFRSSHASIWSSDCDAFVEGTTEAETADWTVGVEQTVREEKGRLFAHLLDGHLDRGQVAPRQSASYLLAVESDTVAIASRLEAMRCRSHDEANR